MRKIVCLYIYGGIFLLFFRCVTGDKSNYIDFLKISEDTFLGIEEVIDSLDVPWDMQYNPETNSIFFTEIRGNISELDLETNTRKVIYTVPHVYQKRTLGLLALAVHPDFKHKPYLYTCYTVKEGEHIFSELIRLKYEKGTVSEPKLLLKIEGSTGHNGSRMVFDKENILYWATGDAVSETHSQDSTTLNGKVLRMTDEGDIPDNNPIKSSYVYAWGFRNIQGITLTSNGHIIAAEHGDAIEDELNWVRPLHNYGWKKIEGYHDLDEEKEYARLHGTTEPIKSWTPVIAPAAVHYPLFNKIPEWKNSLLLTTLKSQTLRVLKLNDAQNSVLEEKVYLKDVYGRIRAVTSDRKGNIYIATSNKDWNPQSGFPMPTDDRILKLSRVDFVPDSYMEEEKSNTGDPKNGKALYQAYCSSCHKDDGAGINGTFPPLTKTVWVQDKNKLLDVILHGLEGKIVVDGLEYDQVMPSFGFLSNQEIAEIATYVRNNFGNSFSIVDSMQVQARKMK